MTPPLARFPDLAGLPIAPLEGGLINHTWRVGEPPVAVLQRLSPIFRPEVNLDIEAITAHLAARGMPTPRLLRTDDDGLWTLDDNGACWRALSWVRGRTVRKLADPALASAAGALVARWHRAVDDLQHEFAFTRPGAHDTVAHMEKLAGLPERHRGHRLHGAVSELADAILEAWARWTGRLDLPPRLAHGDLKISNLRFDERGAGISLVDLDTMAWLPLDVELGDAWRSWCNPAAEDVTQAVFSLPLFEASARAYVAERPVPQSWCEPLAAGVERICLELASRFAADALEECYFGWSEAVAPGRGEHNLLRARGQLSLSRSALAQRADMVRILRQANAAGSAG